MLFGMKSSPVASKCVTHTFMIIILYKSMWKQHLGTLRQLFEDLYGDKLTFNQVKTCTSNISRACSWTGSSKTCECQICAISEFPRPESKKQLMHFLGMVYHFRNFVVIFTCSWTINKLVKEKFEIYLECTVWKKINQGLKVFCKMHLFCQLQISVCTF